MANFGRVMLDFGRVGSLGMPLLDVDGVSLAYRVQGRGPGLLVPLCNFDWNATNGVRALAEHFTVVVAAPRGYSSSTWLDDGAYDTASTCEDLVAVCRAVGLERFSVAGYSLTAALALRLAAHSARVRAVVAGGFPYIPDWTLLRSDVRERAGVGDDPEEDARVSAQLGFDVRAARTFYDDLASLPPGALLDDVEVPLFAFWGSDDEVIEQFEGRDHLASAVQARGIEHRVVAGTDHTGTLLALDGLLPELIDWLRPVADGG
jgi:pimeloyl-ACP methyl ester carboxylesterase